MISDPIFATVVSGLHLIVCHSKTKHYFKTTILQYMAIRLMCTLRGCQQLSSSEKSYQHYHLKYFVATLCYLITNGIWIYGVFKTFCHSICNPPFVIFSYFNFFRVFQSKLEKKHPKMGIIETYEIRGLKWMKIFNKHWSRYADSNKKVSILVIRWINIPTWHSDYQKCNRAAR